MRVYRVESAVPMHSRALMRSWSELKQMKQLESITKHDALAPKGARKLQIGIQGAGSLIERTVGFQPASSRKRARCPRSSGLQLQRCASAREPNDQLARLTKRSRAGFPCSATGKPSVVALHHRAHDSWAFPFFRAVPRQVGTRLLGLRLVSCATSDEEYGCGQQEAIQQSLDK